MLDGLFMLLILSLVMAIASFLAGSLPLTLTLTTSQLRLISTLGMGVLVGTSLIVIIPEGIETLYTAHTVSTQPLHQLRAAPAQLDTTWPRVRTVDMDQGGRVMIRDIVSDRVQAEKDHAFNTLPGPVVPGAAPKTNPNIPKPAQQKNPPDFHTQDAGGVESSPAGKKDSVHQERSPHAYVGLSLIFGFILMYLIDQIPQHASRSLRSTSQPHHISLANLGQGLRRISSQNGQLVQGGDAESDSSTSSARGFSTTIGLVIHAAADGIAMGASSSSANNRLGFIIFLAIMVHKAPAAFGLTSVLLKQGLTKREARARLTIFSLAAPFGAVATWTVVSVLGPSRMGGEEGTHWWTGILLLFSAGTFLYVAMHTMQQKSVFGNDSEASNGYSELGAGDRVRKEDGPEMRDTVVAVAGMLLPLLTQLGHHH